MKIYRLVSRKYAKDLSGEGARLFGGRWNHKGTPCLYAAETRALAVLEYSVNIDLYRIPGTLCLITYEVPETSLKTCPMASLPGNWQVSPAPGETRDFGTALLSQAAHLVIQVPSSIIVEEFNYLLNPQHPDMDKVKMIDICDFSYNLRIKG